MPDDQNTPQNQDSTENPSPVSPQAPTEQPPISTPVSEPVAMTPEAPESSQEGFEVKSTDIPSSAEGSGRVQAPSNETEKEPEIPTSIPSSSEARAPELSDVPALPNNPTAQIPVNEPFDSAQDLRPLTETGAVEVSHSSRAREFFARARAAIQFRKRKKLDRIMSLFLKQSKITNDEVEKFLHVSDATATRYLEALEKEGKIKRNFQKGKHVSYSPK